MIGKEKIYFLLNKIDDQRILTPSGQPVLIHPFGDLKGHYPDVELLMLLKKLNGLYFNIIAHSLNCFQYFFITFIDLR